MIWSAETFNRYLEQTQRNTVVDVRGGKYVRNHHGTIISAHETQQEWQHPWWMTPVWDAEDEVWRISVKPGMVNGAEVWADEAQITRGGTLEVSAWQYGARAPESLKEAAAGKDVRTAKVFLITPRITSTQQIAVGEFPGGRTIDITTTFNGSIFNHSNRYQLITAMDYDQRAEPSEEDFYNGTASEPPFDSITIATLYAIGEAGTDVDGSWSIFPQYNCYWNLNHASKMDRGTELEELKVNFDTALVSGIANPTVRELTRTDANLAEQVRAWFAKTSSAGEFWTT